MEGIRKYMITDGKIILGKGFANYYSGVDGLIPKGYRFNWAHDSKECLMINVEATID